MLAEIITLVNTRKREEKYYIKGPQHRLSGMLRHGHVEREDVEPAIDDGQVAGEALPVHDEAKAVDAHVRAGSEDVGDYPDHPVASAAFLRWERLASIEVKE
jgi:hypothetical protein